MISSTLQASRANRDGPKRESLDPAAVGATSPHGTEGLHVAIIMDGNGRWAEARRRPRHEGHAAGADAVRRTVEAAPELGIATLTLYAFSSDNWRRPPLEVAHLMGLFQRYLRSECARCVENGVRLSVIGRWDRLSPDLRDAIEKTETATGAGTRLHLRIAIDYSARDAMVAAAASLPWGGTLSRDWFDAALARVTNAPPGTPDVDLLIRTGGERRLSDFLLWESAYAELVFIERAWPDFTAEDLEAAVREFAARERRFGGLAASDPPDLAGPARRPSRPGPNENRPGPNERMTAS